MAGASPIPRPPAAVRLAPHAVLGALTAGLAAANLGAAPRVAAVAVVAAAAVAVVAMAARSPGVALAALCAASLAAGWAWGGARVVAASPPAVASGAVSGEVVVHGGVTATPGRAVRAVAVAERLSGPGAALRGRRVMLEVPAGTALEPGLRLRVRGRLGPAATRADPAWWRRHLSRQGIAARLVAVGTVPAGRRGGWLGARDRWRAWVQHRAASGVPGDRGALVRGMALGGDTGLGEGAAQAFRDAGLWHLLAVSGQNVAVVALAVLGLARLLGVPRRPALGVAATTVAAYCLACDGGPSVTRAGIVGGLTLAGELLSASRDRWHLLLVALAAILAVSPYAALDPGLQLSFAAVAGIFLVAPVATPVLAAVLPRRVAELAGMALAAGLATAPVLALHFGRLSLVGLVLNVVAVPLAGPVVVAALAGIAAGAAVPAAGAVLSAAAGGGAAVLLALARAGAAVPGAAVDVPPWTALPLLAPPVALPVLATVLARPGRPGRPGHRVRGLASAPPRGAVVIAVVAAALLVARASAGPAVRPWPSAPAVTALDIGQGDAILLRSPDGAAALIDTGPPGEPAPVVRALRREGVTSLSLVAVTHDQRDHSGALGEVLARYPVGLVAHPPLGPDAERVRADVAAARASGVPTRELTRGARVRVGEWALDVLAPTGAPPAGADPNPYGLVVAARAGDFDVLLTADVESDALPATALRGVEVLKVAHHGSRDAGLRRLLARLAPAAALVSVGDGNGYGHPTPETLAALRSAGVATWRTDRDGSVTVTPAGPGVAVDAAR